MHRWSAILALLATALLTWPAAAQDYPTRPIRAIASQGPGGLSDLFMRALGDQMGPALGTSIVVEDRVGAEGTVGAPVKVTGFVRYAVGEGIEKQGSE